MHENEKNIFDCVIGSFCDLVAVCSIHLYFLKHLTCIGKTFRKLYSRQVIIWVIIWFILFLSRHFYRRSYSHKQFLSRFIGKPRDSYYLWVLNPKKLHSAIRESVKPKSRKVLRRWITWYPQGFGCGYSFFCRGRSC